MARLKEKAGKLRSLMSGTLIINERYANYWQIGMRMVIESSFLR